MVYALNLNFSFLNIYLLKNQFVEGMDRGIHSVGYIIAPISHRHVKMCHGYHSNELLDEYFFSVLQLESEIEQSDATIPASSEETSLW